MLLRGRLHTKDPIFVDEQIFFQLVIVTCGYVRLRPQEKDHIKSRTSLNYAHHGSVPKADL